MRLITQRSQVQILPPLQVKLQVRGPFSLRGGRASWRSCKHSVSRGHLRPRADWGGTTRSRRLNSEPAQRRSIALVA